MPPSGYMRVVRMWNALVMDELMQLARLEHLSHDVAAAHEFALHIQLGNCWPVGKGLDAVANTHVVQNVHVLERYSEMIEHLRDLRRKTALGKLRGALHEQHDVVAGDRLADPIMDGVLVGHLQLSLDGLAAIAAAWANKMRLLTAQDGWHQISSQRGGDHA